MYVQGRCLFVLHCITRLHNFLQHSIYALWKGNKALSASAITTAEDQNCSTRSTQAAANSPDISDWIVKWRNFVEGLEEDVSVRGLHVSEEGRIGGISTVTVSTQQLCGLNVHKTNMPFQVT